MPKKKAELAIDFTRKIMTVNTAYRQFIQTKLKDYNVDLTYEMLQVLACLWTKDGINQQEIANITVKDKASMTYLIDNLTKRGLVTRLEDATDRRNKLILLTESGNALRTKIQPLVIEMYDAAGRDIDIHLLEGCMELLGRIEENLKIQ